MIQSVGPIEVCWRRGEQILSRPFNVKVDPWRSANQGWRCSNEKNVRGESVELRMLTLTPNASSNFPCHQNEVRPDYLALVPSLERSVSTDRGSSDRC